jgi:hypothetical protein
MILVHSLELVPTENSVFIVIAQQYFDYCLRIRCLYMNIYSSPTLPTFRRHVTILKQLVYVASAALWRIIRNRVSSLGYGWMRFAKKACGVGQVKWRTSLALTVNLFLKDEVFVSIALSPLQIIPEISSGHLSGGEDGGKLTLIRLYSSTSQYMCYLIHSFMLFLIYCGTRDTSVNIATGIVA